MRSVTCLALLLAMNPPTFADQGKDKPVKTALLLIDIQNFYYPGGKSELFQPGPAGKNAGKLLEKFRSDDMLVIHVRHNSEPGGEIHEDVRPLKEEKVISKNEVNAFKGTDLLDYLKEHEIKRILVAGMMTHMCVEAATRAASDYGFETVVIGDACATRELKFGDVEVDAKSVHYSTLATLARHYAEVVDTEEFLSR